MARNITKACKPFRTAAGVRGMKKDSRGRVKFCKLNGRSKK